MEALDQKDLELERLATLDKEIDGLLSEGASFNERDDEIVGLQREKAENMSDGATSGKKMTVKEKIEKELAYVTEARTLITSDRGTGTLNLRESMKSRRRQRNVWRSYRRGRTSVNCLNGAISRGHLSRSRITLPSTTRKSKRRLRVKAMKTNCSGFSRMNGRENSTRMAKTWSS